MNFSNCPKPKILFGDNSGYSGATWRGYITRATLIAIGFGGYVLLRKNLDLTGNAKRCFYALRKYFPRGKDDENGDKDRRECATVYDNETCPVCLGSSKTGVRASCGHFLCAKCLARYCEISRTNSPPCPLCRKPLNSVSLLRISNFTENLLIANQDLAHLNPVSDCGNETTPDYVLENGNGDGDGDGDREPNPESRTSFSFVTNWRDRRKYLRNFIVWSSLVVALMVPCCEFIGYGSIFDFLMRLLVVMPTIYIWFMYRDRIACRFATVPQE